MVSQDFMYGRLLLGILLINDIKDRFYNVKQQDFESFVKENAQ